MIETIAAIATARGPGGVAIVRISGPAAIEIAAAVVGKRPDALPERRLVGAVARAQDGSRLDDVLVVAMRAPRSFTGEDVAELHGHGGTVNAGLLLREVLARGARLAEAGEFSRRAFERGKLDASAAEGLLGVIEAASERAWRVAQAQLDGRMSERVATLRAAVTSVLAEVEGVVDFPDEGLEHLGERHTAREVRSLGDACGELAATFRLGRALRDGVEVALRGPVNAGKSSLFNALLGRDRSIVSDTPGTTRDYVEARVEWDGVGVTLIDTAGEREGVGEGEIEARGMAMARTRAAHADVVAWIAEDGRAPADAGVDPSRVVVVQSKGDLRDPVEGAVWTSARTGGGMDELRARILVAAGATGGGDDEVVVTSERQRGLLARAADGLGRGADSLAAGRAAELVAVDLRDALSALAEVTGEEIGDDVLDAVFARFCIGK